LIGSVKGGSREPPFVWSLVHLGSSRSGSVILRQRTSLGGRMRTGSDQAHSHGERDPGRKSVIGHCHLPVSAKTKSHARKMPKHDHHEKAAHHHEQAAKHHREAAKHHQAGNHEKAAHHSKIAHGHHLHAGEHHDHASKKHAEEHG